MKIAKRIIKRFSNHNEAVLSTAQLIMLPTITIKAQKQILIEQEYQLITFTETEMKLHFVSGYVVITGLNFVIKMMYANEILIEGEIISITFQNE